MWKSARHAECPVPVAVAHASVLAWVPQLGERTQHRLVQGARSAAEESGRITVEQEDVREEMMPEQAFEE